MEGHVASGWRSPLALCGVDRSLRQARCDKLIRRPPTADHAMFHIAHAHKPLLGQVRLNHGFRAIRVAHFDVASLFALQQPLRF